VFEFCPACGAGVEVFVLPGFSQRKELLAGAGEKKRIENAEPRLVEIGLFGKMLARHFLHFLSLRLVVVPVVLLLRLLLLLRSC
jgi:hypothetical protein